MLLGYCEQKTGNKAVANEATRRDIKNELSTTNKHIIYNLAYFSIKILNILKSKVLPKSPGNKI